MAACAKEVMDEISMVGWVSGGHSAGFVPVFAIGAGSHLFSEENRQYGDSQKNC